MRGENWSILQLPGLSPQHQRLLVRAGVSTTLALIESGVDLGPRLGVPERLLRRWLALAELARVPGVGCKYCGVLLHAGIATVEQLSRSSPPRLQDHILRLQVATLRRRDLCPPVSQVQEWVRQAGLLVRAEIADSERR